jgi:hypothetical protein
VIVDGGWRATYGGVTKGALGDGLEERRLADVRKANLAITVNVRTRQDQLGRALTHDTSLQVVSWPAERELLLLDLLLGRHLFLLGRGRVGASSSEGKEKFGGGR